MSLSGAPARTPERNREWIEALVDALAHLGEAANLSCSRAKLRRAVERALATSPGSPWPDVLYVAGAAVGLAVRAYRISPRDLSDRAVELRPLVTIVQRSAGPVTVAVTAGKKRVAVVEPRSPERPGKATPVELQQMLDLAMNEVTCFVAAEPTASLDVMHRSVTSGAPHARLLALLRLEQDDLWVTVVYAVVVGLLSLVAPLGVQTLVNTVAFGALLQPLAVLTAMLFVGLAFAGVLRALQAWVVERVQQRLFVRTALDLAHRLPRIEASVLRDEYGPELVNRFFDVVTIQKGAAALLVEGIAIFLQTVVGMVILGLYHPLLLAFAAILTVSIAFIVFVLGRHATPTAVKESKMKYEVAAWLQELVRHESVFRSDRGAQLAVTHAEDLVRSWLGARRKHFSIVFRQIGGALGLQAMSSAALLGVGGMLVINRQLTLGQLVAAELIVTAVVAGFSKLGKYFESYYDLLAGVDKLGALVDLPLARTGVAVRGEGPAAVDVRSSQARGPSLQVARGARVGVYVTDAAEADSLAAALAGEASPSESYLDLDGTDGRELSVAAIRGAVAVVRGPEIFGGTVAENVSGGQVCSAAELRDALELCGVWDIVSFHPDALEAELATNAPSLSREAALRLTLARAVVGHPRVLVIDRAFDVLPPGARRELVARLAARERPWTFILLTTDPAAANELEDHVETSNGRIVSEAT